MDTFTAGTRWGLRYSSLTCAVLTLSTAALPLAAEEQASVKQAETLRRIERSQEAQKLVVLADAAYEASQYGDAVNSYKRALGLLPSAPATAEYKQAVQDRYAKAVVAYSTELNREGKYKESKALVANLMESKVYKSDPLVADADTKLLDPIRNNPSVTKEHAANVDKVRKLLYVADGAYKLGDYDKAFKKYEAILLLDKYNQAARRGMTRLSNERAAYGRAAHDEARARMLTDIDKSWQIKPRADFYLGATEILESREGVTSLFQDLREKLAKIVIPKFDVEDVSIDVALNRFRQLVADNDPVVDQTKKGVNVVLNLGGELNLQGVAIRKTRFKLSLTNIPADKLLDLICKQSGTEWSADQFSVTVLPNGQVSDQLFTRQFSVPPGFLKKPLEGKGNNDLFTDLGSKGGVARRNISTQEYLEGFGLTFPKGSRASYSASFNRLSVTNTPKNMRILAQAIADLKMQQNVVVNVRLKVIDILQDDLEELGFDWLLAPNKLQGGGNGLWIGGGNTGNGTAIDPIQLGNQNPVSGGSMTAGNRSGGGAFPLDSMDSRINQVSNLSQIGQNLQRSPAILQTTAFLNDSHVQMIMRGVEQKKGDSRIWSPSVSTMPGQRARLEQTRLFIYPTEYDPPEIPDNVGAGQNPPIIPAMPTAFEERPVGMIFDVEPVVDPKRRYISLSLEPEFSEFIGFINYGSPILALGTDPLTGRPVALETTPNDILMPIFEKITVKTNVTIADGATVALAGVTRMEIQVVNDKVPVLGSLPFVGRYFQSNGTKTIRRAVLILVTVDLVDPLGNKWRDVTNF